MDYLPTNWNKLSLSKILKIKHGKNQKQVECDDGEYPIQRGSGAGNDTEGKAYRGGGKPPHRHQGYEGGGSVT